MSQPDSAPKDFQRRLDAWIAANGDLLEAHRNHGSASFEDSVQHEHELQQVLFDSGWTRSGWPEDCGGLGGDARNRAILYDRFGAYGYVLPELLGVTETLGPMMTEFARPIAQAHLGRLLRGDEMWCQGFSEPNAGSDLGSLRTRAVEEDGGFRVNGQKIWVSLGHVSQWCVLLARTGPIESAHRGLTMFFVDMSIPGVTVQPIRAGNGRNEFSELFFDDVRLGRDALIGEVGSGWAVSMYLLQWERGMYAWQRQAWLHKRFDDLLSALGSLDSPPADSAERLGDAYLDLASLRARCRHTVGELSGGRNPGPEISVDKLLLSTAEQRLFDVAVELLESDVAVAAEADGWRNDYLFSRSTSIFGGAAEIQRGIVAQRVLGLPREPSVGR